MMSKKMMSFILRSSILLMLCTYIAHSTEILFDQNEDQLKNISKTTAQKFGTKMLNPSELYFEQDLLNSNILLKVNSDIIRDAKENDFTALNCIASFYIEGTILKKNENKGISIFLWLAEEHDVNAFFNLYEVCKQKGFYEQSDKWRQLAQTYRHPRMIEEELED